MSKIQLIIFLIITAIFHLLFLLIIIAFFNTANPEIGFWGACIEFFQSDYFWHILGGTFLISLVIAFLIWSQVSSYFE